MTTANPTITASLFSAMPDEQLLSRVGELAQRERRATAELVAALAEVDRRRLYLPRGYASMFTYCTHELHLSEHGAYNRIEAARAARRFPVILGLLDEGALTLTAVRLLAPVLTPENQETLIAEARYKSRREIEVLVAGVRPQPDVRAVIRALPPRPSHPAPAIVCPTDPSASAAYDPRRAVVTQQPATLASRPDPPLQFKPLSPQRYLLRFTLSKEAHDILRQLQALERHSVPDGDVGQIIERALRSLLADLHRTKVAASHRPRPTRNTASVSRHIPAAIKREVWKRDGGRCGFTGTEGRCREEAFLEYHHVVPFAAGGAATIANIELRCRAHNAYEADQFFGKLDLQTEPQA